LLGCQENTKSPEIPSGSSAIDPATYAQTTKIPEGILTPDQVETSIGMLKFFDGAPLPETAELVYDNLDRMRGVDVFLKCMPAASVRQLMLGPESLGADAYYKVPIFDKLMDSKPLFLTGNTSTLYVLPSLNLIETGPMVLEVPPGMLGAFNDAWFRYMQDVGPLGQDKGAGGSYLVLPPDFEGDIPDGYFIVQSPTYRVWTFMRGSIANGIDAGGQQCKRQPEGISLSPKRQSSYHGIYQRIRKILQYDP
jgi:hypothetical protein